jgi:hypothetical protein
LRLSRISICLHAGDVADAAYHIDTTSPDNRPWTVTNSSERILMNSGILAIRLAHYHRADDMLTRQEMLDESAIYNIVARHHGLRSSVTIGWGASTQMTERARTDVGQ